MFPGAEDSPKPAKGGQIVSRGVLHRRQLHALDLDSRLMSARQLRRPVPLIGRSG